MVVFVWVAAFKVTVFISLELVAAELPSCVWAVARIDNDLVEILQPLDPMVDGSWTFFSTDDPQAELAELVDRPWILAVCDDQLIKWVEQLNLLDCLGVGQPHLIKLSKNKKTSARLVKVIFNIGQRICRKPKV